MGWRIIYIEQAMNVRLYLDNIKIEETTTAVTIPLNDIHTIIIDNYKITVSVQLITKCSEYNINLIICGINHLPISMIEPFTGNYQTPLMLHKQIEWNDASKLFVHQLIVRNKIINQASLLKKLNLSNEVYNHLLQFAEEVDLGDTTNREGLAAKMYFRELFGNDFKRFNDDLMNAGLNYGYSILRSQISKTIVAKGLNPCLGIIHKGQTNSFNLSDDLIEVFRPLIDYYVFNNLKDAIMFTRNHRLALIKCTTQDVKINNTKQSVFNAISIFVDGIIQVFEMGDVSKFMEVKLLYEL